MEGLACHHDGMIDNDCVANRTSATNRAIDAIDTNDTSDTHRTIAPSILYYGTPVALLSTTNPDGSTNLAPMSSSWALGDAIVLGMALGSRTASNLEAGSDVVVNLQDAGLWRQVETLGDLTGNAEARPGHQHGAAPCHDKFAAVGFTSEPSELICPERVSQCPLQLECRTVSVEHDALRDGFLIVQARVIRVHADASLIVPGTDHIDPKRWKPLIYNFRHYFTLGAQLGESRISETPAPQR
ncbi:MAG: flavin reductase family protein [Bifidobacterium subtile]|jgi:flavin reductase (DIM6/NTAB) family NADH-FMN oxidoreductase RutF|nr:flavin reductase family protein [Bifidobacterium subtile]